MTEEYIGETKQSSSSTVARREVNILFNGLFFFSFPDSRQTKSPFNREFCNVGILSTRQGAQKDHSFFIRFKQTGRPSEPIEIPHSVLSKLPAEIEITKTGSFAEDLVTIRGFDNVSGWGARSESDRLNRTITPDYFNWIIDFEALHNRNLNETLGSLRPRLKFKVGDFYTNFVSLNQYFRQQGDEPESLFGYVAATIGALIVLTDEEQLVIKVDSVSHPLPMDITEIHLNNVRPEHLKEALEGEELNRESHSHADSSDPHEGHAVSPHEGHDDDTQIYYYDLLQGVAPGERFHFRPILRQMDEHRFSPPFICFGSGGSRQ